MTDDREIITRAIYDNHTDTPPEIATTILSALTAAGRVIVDAGEVCIACGQPWTGEKCGQAENGWDFPTCSPILVREKSETAQRDLAAAHALLREARVGLEPLSKLWVWTDTYPDGPLSATPMGRPVKPEAILTARALATKIAALLSKEKPL